MSKSVSVIIPTFRRPNHLILSIESVLSQTYENIVVIVVDDNDPNSKDRTLTEEKMKKYKYNDSVVYLKHEKNKGGSAARNTGAHYNESDYIAFLDDDDLFLPEKIEKQVNMLESLDESWGVSYTGFLRKNNGKLIDKGVENAQGHIWKSVLKGELYISAGSNILLKRTIYDEVGGFDENFVRRQDLEFLIRISKVSKVCCVKESLLVINKDDRRNSKLSKKTSENNIATFLNSFESYIDELNDQEKEQVFMSLKLQEFRKILLSFKPLETYRFAKNNKISFSLFSRYVLYLADRKIFKKCYGFKM